MAIDLEIHTFDVGTMITKKRVSILTLTFSVFLMYEMDKSELGVICASISRHFFHFTVPHIVFVARGKILVCSFNNIALLI